ncbi:hypothetical protein [Microcella flavibacter]|uniref:hypothetical protein n=1 Tax=Microcella flavibacter TaxID=1804990 RepID=UPI001E33C632|nr:hypothetical protein [Microcella flavibacter]
MLRDAVGVLLAQRLQLEPGALIELAPGDLLVDRRIVMPRRRLGVRPTSADALLTPPGRAVRPLAAAAARTIAAEPVGALAATSAATIGSGGTTAAADGAIRPSAELAGRPLIIAAGARAGSSASPSTDVAG